MTKLLGILVAALVFAISHSGAAFAAECKGKTKPACDRDKSCVHVASYTRSDGVKVNAYCRNKGGNGSSSSAKKMKDE